MAKIGQTDDCLSSLGGILAGLSLIITLMLVFIGVVARYILRLAVVFIDEYTGYLLVLMSFMGLAYTLRTEGHIDVDLLIRHLRKKPKLWIRTATALIALALTILLTIQTGNKMLDSYRLKAISTSPLETPLFIPQMFIPIGLGLLAISLIAMICKNVREVRTAGDKEDGH